jgi:hypothetical protein
MFRLRKAAIASNNFTKLKKAWIQRLDCSR